MGTNFRKSILFDVNSLSDDELEALSWEELLRLRRENEGNQQAQNRLSQFEHGAYAREDVAASPERALGYAVTIPAYNLYKQMTGVGRSEPSVGQIVQGYKGVYQGLLSAMKNKFAGTGNKVLDTIIPSAQAESINKAPATGSAEWRKQHEDRRIEAMPWEEAQKLYGEFGKGNISLNNRPVYVYPEKENAGSYSSLESMTITDDDGKYVLIPKVSDKGNMLTEEEAYNNYVKSGKYLGKFKSDKEATDYAIGLERRQQSYYERGPGKVILNSIMKNKK